MIILNVHGEFKKSTIKVNKNALLKYEQNNLFSTIKKIHQTI